MNHDFPKNMSPVFIAEIGCNHKGDINIAKEFINIARDFCKVNFVKFQKRNVSQVLSEDEYNSPHPNPVHSYGETYGKHREFLEFSIEQHKELKNYCEERGMFYGCSVYDITSLKEILSIKPNFIKIPSAVNTHFDMLNYLCNNYNGLIHISLGMTTIEEERRIVDFFEKNKRIQDVILYACTSGYPVPPEDVSLLEIKRLYEAYGNDVYAIGFSGHHNGISIDIAAYTLGAVYIERHFTLDRTWKGTDHAASLEPDGLRRLNRDLHNVAKTLTYKSQEILDIEIPQRNKLKWDRNFNSPPVIQKDTITHKNINLSDIKLLCTDVDGVMTDSGMYYSEDGNEIKKFNTRDGHAIAMLKKAGIKTAIITREKTEIVSRRAKKIGVDYLHQGVLDKLEKVKDLINKNNILSSEVCYIGDDLNDLQVLNFVGLSVVPRDSVIDCKLAADYITRVKGGEGCIREVADLILSKKTYKV